MKCLENVRGHFPQITYLDKKGETYLDSAATTLKLASVRDFLQNFYSSKVSNVHRGTHALSMELTDLYEESREQIAQFIGAKKREEIVFTRSTTEGLNYLATSLLEDFSKGDEILLTEAEHHSNLIPWQQLAKKHQVKIKYIPVDQEGKLDISSIDTLFTSSTKLMSIAHVSNALGNLNPLDVLLKKAKQNKVLTVVDAAQSVSVLPIDVS